MRINDYIKTFKLSKNHKIKTQYIAVILGLQVASYILLSFLQVVPIAIGTNSPDTLG